MQDPIFEHGCQMNRRHFFSTLSLGIGGAALASLLGCDDQSEIAPGAFSGVLKGLHHTPRARRVIYLFQSGGPSQLELFDYKPVLRERRGEDLPSLRSHGSTAYGDDRVPEHAAPRPHPVPIQATRWLRRLGQQPLLPHTAAIADDICIVRSMYTEAINHDPAITFFQTGSQQPGRPSMGSWFSYGLGSANENLPAFCVLLSRGLQRPQPIYSRLWGNGFLAALHQGVQFRTGGDPVLYLNNPPGIQPSDRRLMLKHLRELNAMRFERSSNPRLESRLAQYEMAYRMQTSVPEVTDLSDEPESTFELYGEDARVPGTYAANCLLARRLAERDVRFVQLYHMGWDQHTDLPRDIALQCADTDRASAALVTDLKQRGMLDDTLVIWGGEFGRTNYSQGQLTEVNYGRDHHPRCFSIWMAGGGVKPGTVYGATDEFGYNITENPVHVHDFQATVLHLMGIEHERLTFRHQGRRYRLTDVHGSVVNDILA